MPHSRFTEGPAGTGKTSHAIQHIRELLQEGVSPESILVLVPQRTLGQPYQVAFAGADWPSGAQIDVVTLGGLARRGLETFWPQIAAQVGSTFPEPVFLTIETAQYFMAGFVNEAIKTGIFDSLSLTPFSIMRQTLDNLSKAAVNRFPLDEVTERLVTAWGDRHSSRPPVYHASLDVAQQFRDHCLQNSLLDFSLQIELFMAYLLHEPLYQTYFQTRFRHLVADNLEESFPVVADFIRWTWNDLESALLIYDTDAGYRLFLGADPAGMYRLRDLCKTKTVRKKPVKMPAVMAALADEFRSVLETPPEPGNDLPANPRKGLVYESRKFYPQMMDWVVEQIAGLVKKGVPPREIVVLAPFLGDSLRFALTTRLNERGIATVSHRPSRAVRDEPAARTVLTLMALAHPEWNIRPPAADVADALHQAIEELDPIRAWLLAQIVYRPSRADLGSFDAIRPETQQRITYRAGEKYELLRAWLAAYQSGTDRLPPDHFLSRLFGEVLARPGFGFHTNLDAGRVVAELVESARKFRQTLYPRGAEEWSGVAKTYVELVQQGVLAALYVASWHDEEKDAVFLAPAYTFLMRNRWVDYQFWLDVGSANWAARLEQPLTHPYVLTREYPSDEMWTDEREAEARQAALRRLIVGLARRCHKRIYAAIADLSEQGFEQRGPLLQVIQQIIQRHPLPEDNEL